MEATAVVLDVEYSPIRHPRFGDIKSMPKPRYKGHWAVATNRFDDYIRFYGVMTGIDVVCTPHTFASVDSWDLEHHRFFVLDLMAMPGQPGKEATKLAQEHAGIGLGAIRYESPAALVALYRRAKAAGYEPNQIVDRGSVVSLQYEDPNGMTFEAFAANPAGASSPARDLTPDELLGRFG